MVREFANGLGDLGSILGQIIPKTQKMVFDASLHYMEGMDQSGAIQGKL